MSVETISYEKDVKTGERFEFGKNWSRFLSVLDEDRINEAVKSLKTMLKVSDLKGRTFVDIGSGSGLFSLAAMRLGAERVHSLDYDPNSVACGKELRRRYYPDATNWIVEQGSALDANYLQSLGQYDIVYSWGVLHHTGNMWLGLQNVVDLVKDGGLLFIAIYNDQGGRSVQWRAVKKVYNSGVFGFALVVGIFVPTFFFGGLIKDVLRLRNPTIRYIEYRKSRGMSVLHDWLDWLGGLPFEVATPEKIFEFYRDRGFNLETLTTNQGRLGCNEFVFSKTRKLGK